MLQGELDYRVPVSQGFEYYNTLHVRGVPARLWHEKFSGWLARYAPGGGR